MNKYKICTILYFVAAICFYLAAILNFLNGSGSMGGVTNFTLGSTFLCLGILWYKQWKKASDKEENKK